MLFSPKPVPTRGLARWLSQAMADIARALRQPQVLVLQLDVLHAEPDRPQDGMVVCADGSDWNPGGTGAGIYARIGGSWVKL